MSKFTATPLTSQQEELLEKLFMDSTHRPKMVQLDIVDDEPQEDEEYPDLENGPEEGPMFNDRRSDIILGQRTHDNGPEGPKNSIELILFRADTPVFSIMLDYELPNKLITQTLSIEPLFPFFDDDDENSITSTLLMMALCIDDFEKLPINIIPELPM